MNQQTTQLQQNIEPLRQQIIQHKVYSAIKTMDDLKLFMQYHVFAVWDFMSLLKTLQNNLTCTRVPWFPNDNAETAYLINEIVLGEETDVDEAGVRKSHFEIYIDAMQQSGANTAQIETFLATLKQGDDLNTAFTASKTPEAAKRFVDFTFNIIASQKAYLQAAIFTFGREDLIPGMFYAIVNDLHERFPENVSIFKYYLERHIEVDGDHHSNLALEMTENLCGTDAAIWAEVEQVTKQSLQKRIELWDGVYDAITNKKAALELVS